MSTVVIIGGGVAGLSAAHMLVRRGFNVEVYERSSTFGGKAKSFKAHGELPGEHGFRFFPGFYTHLPGTMQEIPLRDETKTVLDNLIPALVVGVTQVNRPSVWLPTRFPGSWIEARNVLHLLANWRNLGVPGKELRTFAYKLLNLAQMCPERRLAEYEGVPWMDYLEADTYSPEYKKLFARGLTRSLVALQADQGSTRTVGNVLLQLLRYMVRPGHSGDRLLNGPTSEAWFDPWVEYLESSPKGAFPNNASVQLFRDSEVSELVLTEGRISAAKVYVQANERSVEGDYFIVAVPVDQAELLLLKRSKTLSEIVDQGEAPLSGIAKLDIEWMSGIQFYLGKPWHDAYGQAIHADSEWALTSVSQRQFWDRFDFGKFGGSDVHGILSVDVSDWETPATRSPSLPAKGCTSEQVRHEVWSQLCDAYPELEEVQLVGSIIDPSIIFCSEHEPDDRRNLIAKLRGRKSAREFNATLTELRGQQHHVDDNVEPLLVNTVESWHRRPTVETVVPNLFLAADYVRTHTDLATMESANEAARRAVNCILRNSGSDAPPEGVFPLKEGVLLAPLRAWDRKRFRNGKPQRRLRATWTVVLWIAGLSLALVAAVARPFVGRARGGGTLGRSTP